MMVKNINKKLFAGILALSAGFVLASCQPVAAVPNNYNTPIVSSTDGAIDVDENILGNLYDQITGDKNDKIVADILKDIAVKKFGSYKEYLESKDTTAKRDAFINAHSEFFGTDDKKVDRYDDFVKDIDSRISEFFYNELKNESYKDERGRFDEEKFYNARKYELFDLGEKSTFNVFYMSNEVTKENAFERFTPGYYNVVEEGKHGYIDEKVFPDILKNKLVEDYIYKNNATSLGRAYARKISYLKISYEKDHTQTWDMLKAFAKNHIETGTLNFELPQLTVKGYTKFADGALVNALYGKDGTEVGETATGHENDAAVCDLLEAEYGAPDTTENTGNMVVVDYTQTGFDAEQYTYLDQVLLPEGAYYKNTKLGKIVEDYNKAIKAELDARFPKDDEKTALDKFTGDGKSKQYGLLKELLSLANEDTTTDGWFVKNGGAGDLPTQIRNRLFNIRVANTLDDLEELPVETGNGYSTVNSPYLRNVNGHKLVLPADSLSYEKDPFNYFYHDVDGKAYYICEVLEAPSTSKLNDKSEVYSAYKKEQIKRQVSKILGTKDSYIKDAYTEYLNKYEFIFSDTSLYEYLKAEYPDLDQFQD